MKKRFDKLQIPLLLILSLLLAVLPSYLCCSKPAQGKFVSSDLSFENPAQEESVPVNQRELKVYRPTDLPRIFLFGICSIEQASQLLAQPLSLHQKTPVLRC